MKTIVRRLLSSKEISYEDNSWSNKSMEPEKAFGLVLKDLRKSKGISQEKLALVGDLDRTFISLMERGQRQPSLTTILRISEALDIKPSELMDLVTKKVSSK